MRSSVILTDFMQLRRLHYHYETRVAEGATVAGKAMFVCSNRKMHTLFIRYSWNETGMGREKRFALTGFN